MVGPIVLFARKSILVPQPHPPQSSIQPRPPRPPSPSLSLQVSLLHTATIMHPSNPAAFAVAAAATAAASSAPQHHPIPFFSAPLQSISPAMSVSQARSASGAVEGHSLDDIPLQYTIDKLHSLGRYYWHKPETTDCCIRAFSPFLPNPRPRS